MGCMGRVDFASDEIQDRLSQRQACDERMEAWTRREDKTLKGLGASDKVASGVRSRRAAIQLMFELQRALKLQAGKAPGADLFEAAQLMDLSARKRGMGKNPGEDLARSLACWVVSLKFATCQESALCERNRQALVGRASVLSTLLGGEAICWEDVRKFEAELVTEGCDCLCMPTVANWLEAFLTRFDVCSGGALAPTLGRATSLGKSWALMVVMQLRTGENHGPRAMAQGLAALVVVMTGAVKMKDLFAHREDSASLTVMLNQVFQQSNARPGQTSLPAEEAKMALEYAVGLDFQDVAELARNILQALLQEFRRHPPLP